MFTVRASILILAFATIVVCAEVRYESRLLPQYGVLAYFPSSLEFSEAVQERSGGTALGTGMERALQLSTFIVNNSGRTISAITIRFHFTNLDGTSGAYNSRLSGLKHPSLWHAGIAHGSSRLVTIEWSIGAAFERRAPATANPISVRSALERLEKHKAIVVSVDSVVFSDGTMIGPDAAGTFAEMQAEVAARLDLVKTVLVKGVDGQEAVQQVLRNAIESGAGKNPRGSPYGFHQMVAAQGIGAMLRRVGLEKTLANLRALSGWWGSLRLTKM